MAFFEPRTAASVTGWHDAGLRAHVASRPSSAGERRAANAQLASFEATPSRSYTSSGATPLRRPASASPLHMKAHSFTPSISPLSHRAKRLQAEASRGCARRTASLSPPVKMREDRALPSPLSEREGRVKCSHRVKQVLAHCGPPSACSSVAQLLRHQTSLVGPNPYRASDPPSLAAWRETSHKQATVGRSAPTPSYTGSEDSMERETAEEESGASRRTPQCSTSEQIVAQARSEQRYWLEREKAKSALAAIGAEGGQYECTSARTASCGGVEQQSDVLASVKQQESVHAVPSSMAAQHATAMKLAGIEPEYDTNRSSQAKLHVERSARDDELMVYNILAAAAKSGRRTETKCSHPPLATSAVNTNLVQEMRDASKSHIQILVSNLRRAHTIAEGKLVLAKRKGASEQVENHTT
ncbi:MAG: hypothetical protein SGPRY_003183 [Prymnesium sp.]